MQFVRVIHSRLSKYLTECIDYILKTEHTLSSNMSLKVQAGSVSMIKLKAVKSSHKAKSLADAIQILLGKINLLDILTRHHDRLLQQKVPRSPFTFDEADLM
ncbi:hypothetical protein MAR_008579, partial [Mya arenaria]